MGLGWEAGKRDAPAAACRWLHALFDDDSCIELDSRSDCHPLLPMTRVGLEPTTYGLKVRCSAS